MKRNKNWDNFKAGDVLQCIGGQRKVLEVLGDLGLRAYVNIQGKKALVSTTSNKKQTPI